MDGTWELNLSNIVTIQFLSKMRAELITNTVVFKHKYIMQPTVMPADAIMKALQDLKVMIKQQMNHIRDKNMAGLLDVKAVLISTSTYTTLPLVTFVNSHLQGCFEMKT